MLRPARPAVLLMSCLVAIALAGTAAAQKPDEPLGELLDVIPLAEKPSGETSEPVASSSPTPPRLPVARPGDVVPVDLPPSAATGEPPPSVAGDQPDAIAEASQPADEAGEDAGLIDPASVEADAAWAALQEERRAEVNSVEAPIVARLNAGVAARAEAEGRRFAEEQAAYERQLVELQEEARRRDAEHAAEMEAFARRVEREQAEYRARVEACRRGDLRACRE